MSPVWKSSLQSFQIHSSPCSEAQLKGTLGGHPSLSARKIAGGHVKSDDTFQIEKVSWFVTSFASNWLSFQVCNISARLGETYSVLYQQTHGTVIKHLYSLGWPFCSAKQFAWWSREADPKRHALWLCYTQIVSIYNAGTAQSKNSDDYIEHETKVDGFWCVLWEVINLSARTLNVVHNCCVYCAMFGLGVWAHSHDLVALLIRLQNPKTVLRYKLIQTRNSVSFVHKNTNEWLVSTYE